MTLTIVIPTYDRAAQLARGIAALADQTATDPYDVIVVDDGSPRPLDDHLRPWFDRLKLTVLRKSNGGLAAARNHGARHATGDVLLFLDDDIVPNREFVAAHLAVHRADGNAVALGSLPHPPDLPLTPFLYYLNRVVHYDLFLRYGSAAAIPLPPLNGNSSLRRDHFEGVGGYDLDFSSYGGEDTEMGYRLLSAGLHFVYAPHAQGFHYHTKGFDAYKRDMYSSGVTMVTIVRKHPEVLSRVNMDIVRTTHALPWRKVLQRGVYQTLRRRPSLVVGLDRILDSLATRGARRLTYPLHLLIGHYHYARGMDDELRRGGLTSCDDHQQPR